MCPSGHGSTRVTTVARPRWTVLYGIAAIGLAAFTVTDITAPPPVRPFVTSAVGGIAAAAIGLWFRGNRAALEQQTWCDCASATVTVRVIAPRRPQDVRPSSTRQPAVVPVNGAEDRAVSGRILDRSLA
jgi:hypothetical protein